MKILNKKQLIKDCNYYTQLICYYIFMIGGIIGGFSPMLAFGINGIVGIISACILLCAIIIPFGYFLGLRKIVEVMKSINRIKNNNLFIIESKVVDKTRVIADDTKRYCQIIFEDNEGIWVSRKINKQIKIGDTCYLIYLKDNDEPSVIYNKKKYKLNDELLECLRGDKC